MTLPKCGCICWGSQDGVQIAFCPLHEAAPDLLTALESGVRLRTVLGTTVADWAAWDNSARAAIAKAKDSR